MRNGGPDFGNPFYVGKEPANKKVGDIKVPNNDVATILYWMWLKSGLTPAKASDAEITALDERREELISNLDKVRSADKLKYYGTAKGKKLNHVKALIDISKMSQAGPDNADSDPMSTSTEPHKKPKTNKPKGGSSDTSTLNKGQKNNEIVVEVEETAPAGKLKGLKSLKKL